MALQTWLALLLCLFFFAVSVYSLISYIKTGEKSVFPLQTENAQKIIRQAPVTAIVVMKVILPFINTIFPRHGNCRKRP
ncbi:hypothetical protein DMB90_04185 [Raoultella planticola]|uniref:Uncharacterized protein n=1 Tax=Raoultella planticola TaxID=575 RepID=A0A5P6A9G9_RAOPL|nr:hypothetical protein DMB90_04185 [Raoultella planticola]